MQATNSQLTDFIGATKQYSIPIFQRPYSWEQSDCLKLLADVIAVAKDEKRPCHFIGSVIYLPKSQFASAINECAVIDGQQRLTTLSLLLLALSDYAKTYYPTQEEYDESETNIDQIKEMYLINKFGKGDLKYKLKLQGTDFRVYKQLLIDRKLPDGVRESRVHSNYLAMLRELNNNKEHLDPEIILSGIRKLLLVDIPLNPEDNAQLVFETVNSTGRPLTEAEKIKNFILMTVAPDEQDELYHDCWAPMETSLSRNEFDTFFRYYLTIKLRKQINNKYYSEFKEYVSKSSLSTKDVVKEVKRYFDYFQRWKASQLHNTPIDNAISGIKESQQDKVTPLVLEVLHDFYEKKCSAEEAEAVLRIVESYWMRRRICGLPSNTAGAVCFSMLKGLGQDHYVDRFISCIRSLTWAQRMPTDGEMKNLLHTTPIYKKSFARFLLDKLEAHENKDYTHSEHHSIEHIMPQTIHSHDELYARTDISTEMKEKLDWAVDLGDDWEKTHTTYLNTLGNLTLTGFNAEYQNYRFTYKKTMQDGYDSSPIRITRSTLASVSSWGEQEIITRSDMLAEIIADIWKYPVKK